MVSIAYDAQGRAQKTYAGLDHPSAASRCREPKILVHNGGNVMVINPPQDQAVVKAETITGMQRSSYRQWFTKSHHKRYAAQKDVQISGISDAKTRILIDP